MNEKSLRTLTEQPAGDDLEQLMRKGRALHNRAVFDAMVSIKNRLKLVLTKGNDCPASAYRLKQS